MANSFNTPYFKHDTHARNNPLLLAVQMKYGLRGLGLWWCLVEIFYEQDNKIHYDQCDSIAYALHEQCEWIAELMQFFLRINLIQYDENEKVFMCFSVEKRINEALNSWQEKTERAKKAANFRWNRNNMQTDSTSNADAMQEQCKTMPIRLDKIRLDKIRLNKRERESLQIFFESKKAEHLLDRFVTIITGKSNIKNLEAYAATYIENELRSGDSKNNNDQSTSAGDIARAIEAVRNRRRSRADQLV